MCGHYLYIFGPTELVRYRRDTNTASATQHNKILPSSIALRRLRNNALRSTNTMGIFFLYLEGVEQQKRNVVAVLRSAQYLFYTAEIV